MIYFLETEQRLFNGITVSQGDINVDQAHRGYDVTYDDTGKAWYNPF